MLRTIANYGRLVLNQSRDVVGVSHAALRRNPAYRSEQQLEGCQALLAVNDLHGVGIATVGWNLLTDDGAEEMIGCIDSFIDVQEILRDLRTSAHNGAQCSSFVQR